MAVTLPDALVGVFYDDGLYVALARSLAEGRGYHFLHLPGAPPAVHYPVLYHAFLAATVVVLAATAIPLLAVATALFAEPLFLALAILACWAADAASGAATREQVGISETFRTVPSFLWRVSGRGARSFGPDSLRAYFDRMGVTHVVFTGPGSEAAPTIDAMLARFPGYLSLIRVWPGSLLAFAVERGG